MLWVKLCVVVKAGLVQSNPRSCYTLLMKITPESDSAVSWDLDDTLIGREPVTRVLGVAKAKLRTPHLPTVAVSDLPHIDRRVSEDPV